MVNKMRNSMEVTEMLGMKFPEQFEFIKGLLRIKDENDNHIYFLGARDNYLNLYYMGQSIAKIEIPDKKEPRYSVAHYIRHGEKKGTKDKPYVELEWEEYQGKFEEIKAHAKENATGTRTDHVTTVHREKICQQWIMNCNNDSIVSDWYFTDMEYIDARKPYGRVDLVAVKKTADENGIHQVALIELKVTNAAYGTTLSKSKIAEKQELINRKYDILRKKSLYTEDSDDPEYNGFHLEKVKFGSGIVSHVADFLRYLNSGQYKNQLRQEIVNTIEVYKRFGCIEDNNPISKIDSIDKLSEKPIVFILSYTNNPADSQNKNLGNEPDKKSELKSLKKSFYNQLFDDGLKNGSKYCLKNVLHNSEVSGFLSIKDELKTAINDDRKNRICLKQGVKDNKDVYEFVIKFWDPVKEKSTQTWNCLNEE